MSESERKPLTSFALKGQARALVAQSKATGGGLTHSQALEQLARRHGFTDWNAARAALDGGAGRHPPRDRSPREDFGELEIPPELEWVQIHDPLGHALARMARLAENLETIADSGQEGSHARLLTLLGDRPYLFEQNPGRWDDDLYHLVDRSYTEVEGFAFNRQELVEMGFEAWGNSDYCGGVGHDDFPVMDDEFMRLADSASLKRLARLVILLATRAEARRNPQG